MRPELVAYGLGALVVVGWWVRFIVRREEELFFRRLLLLAVGAKTLGTVLRYQVMADLYARGDFRRYLTNGSAIADELRSGQWPEEASQLGTPFMDFLSGVAFVFLPNTLMAGFAFFSLLSFIGAYLFFLAFRIAVTGGELKRYAVFIFFTPTMLFWPSSLGKESWLVFTLGFAAYGAARVLKRLRGGYVLTLIGILAMFAVRPHMGALFALAFVGAYALRFRDQEIKKSAVAWLTGLMIVGLGAGLVATNFGDELPRDESVDGTVTDQIFAETERRTTTGGASFDSRPVRGPGDLGHAMLTVPFRPFPWEGHNLQAVVAGLEGLILLLIVLFSLPRLAALPTRVLKQPYVALAAAYSLGFIVAFSNVGNFGILTRQRAQLIPLLLVLVCLPPLGARLRQPRRFTSPLVDGAPGAATTPATGPLIYAPTTARPAPTARSSSVGDQPPVSSGGALDSPDAGALRDGPLVPAHDREGT